MRVAEQGRRAVPGDGAVVCPSAFCGWGHLVGMDIAMLVSVPSRTTADECRPAVTRHPPRLGRRARPNGRPGRVDLVELVGVGGPGAQIPPAPAPGAPSPLD